MPHPTYWGPAMSESQHAVFRFNVKTMVMADDTPLIFDTLPDAERHCQENIAATPALGCRILDHFGKKIRTSLTNRSTTNTTAVLLPNGMSCWAPRC